MTQWECRRVSEVPRAGLRREIGLTGSAFLAFNGIVGAGIFGLPGQLHEKFAGFAPLLFPLFALPILLIALPFARLAAVHSATGGPVASRAALRTTDVWTEAGRWFAHLTP